MTEYLFTISRKENKRPAGQASKVSLGIEKFSLEGEATSFGAAIDMEDLGKPALG